MSDLVFRVLSWPTLAIALVVFGFAPGALLRVIALAFPLNDPRRQELLGELHAVPRIERPFWVVEQLEVALFEGLGGRLASKRIKRNSDESDRPHPGRNLTPRQLEVLQAIERFQQQHKYAPSVRDIGEAVGLTPPTIMRNLHALREKGWV